MGWQIRPMAFLFCPRAGIGFGEEGENYLRLAMVENEHRIRQAIRQMRRALPKISEAAERG